MNLVVMIGNLTKDPELRFIPNSGTAIARFSIAVGRDYKTEGQPDVDYFNIVVWGKAAENCANYLKKGKKVGVTGELRNNNYEDKQGVKHYNNEINAQKVEFLTPKGEVTNNPSTTVDKKQDDFNGFQAMDESEDIPF